MIIHTTIIAHTLMYFAQAVDKLPHKLYDQLYRPMNMLLPMLSVRA